MRILFTLLLLALSTACSETTDTPDPDLDTPMAAAGDDDEGLYGADDEEEDQ